MMDGVTGGAGPVGLALHQRGDAFSNLASAVAACRAVRPAGGLPGT
jgi:hypothetical protein